MWSRFLGNNRQILEKSDRLNWRNICRQKKIEEKYETKTSTKM